MNENLSRFDLLGYVVIGIEHDPTNVFEISEFLKKERIRKKEKANERDPHNPIEEIPEKIAEYLLGELVEAIEEHNWRYLDILVRHSNEFLIRYEPEEEEENRYDK